MRILLVINGTDFGGSEVALSRIAAKLKSRRHHVHVLSLKSVGPVGRRIAEADIELSSLEMTASVNPLDVVRSSVALARWLRRRDFDLIHSFLPRANVISRLANCLAGARRPHVASERSTDFRRSRAVRLLNRLTMRWSDLIVAVSPAVRDVLVHRDGVPPERIVVLPTGVDLEAIERSPASDVRSEIGVGNGDAIVCSVGRLVPDKGHAYLLHAMAIQGMADVHVVLVGGGSEEGRLREKAETLGLTRRVHFLGFRADAVGVMKASDVFVLPSLEEGLPVVLLEAMACALPVVASDVGGVAQLIRAGETGLLVPPVQVWNGNGITSSPSAVDGVNALADALTTVLRDRKRARAMGLAGRRLVERFHTLEREVDGLERLYAPLVARRIPGRGTV